MLCGKGNNGGDGFVAARKLHEWNRQVQVLLLGKSDELQGDAATMFSRLPVQAVPILEAPEFGNAKGRSAFASDLLLDALLGTGFRPPVKGLYAHAIEAMNAQTAPVVAVDIPSGADADAMGAQSGCRSPAPTMS